MGLFRCATGWRKSGEGSSLSARTGSLGPRHSEAFAGAPKPPPEDLVNKAKVLDNLYIPTRYPNGHPDGSPFEHYGPIQSEQAIEYASEILEFVRIQMAEPGER